MQTSPSKPMISRTVLAILLLIVSAASVYYYFDSQAAQLNSNQEIIRLTANYDAEKLTALALQSEVVSLNQSITSLDSQISSLLNNRTFSAVEIMSLKHQVAQLQNESALATLQLSVVEHISKLVINQLVVNRTVTVSPNSSMLAASWAGGHNGTFVFISPTGCRLSGTMEISSRPIVENIILDSRVLPIGSIYASYGAQQFTVNFLNVGPAAVQCKYSAFFVYSSKG